ncbi:hypothetical protein BDZ89DRAFT_214567 [Hymenopellis radicata]|nr:hypothetical protein BDZ89DRAFT_214567 [Hymenopellis radicata]
MKVRGGKEACDRINLYVNALTLTVIILILTGGNYCTLCACPFDDLTTRNSQDSAFIE